jgi:hypothetical protein
MTVDDGKGASRDEIHSPPRTLLARFSLIADPDPIEHGAPVALQLGPLAPSPTLLFCLLIASPLLTVLLFCPFRLA